MSELAIGIDLGTSTSEIAVFRNGSPQMINDPSKGVPIMPSCVAVNNHGKLFVGHDATSWVEKTGHGVREVKRKMGTAETVRLGQEEYLPQEISSYILNKLKSNAEEALGVKIEDIVLTVPANFPDSSREATRVAAELAGLNVIRLINEPTAAALSYGISNLDREEQLVVFDFGGGTLDVSVLEMFAGVLDVVASFGNIKLGGKNIDELLQDRFSQQFARKHPNAELTQRAESDLKILAEKAKKHLSHEISFSDVIVSFAEVGGKSIDLEVALTREEFEHVIQPILEEAKSVVKQALQAKKVRPSSISRVLLVGGSTYIPAVRSMLKELFGKEPEPAEEPDLAVAMGACIQAALVKNLISNEDGIILTDVSPFGLGVDILDIVGGQFMMVYDALMPPNTKVPYSVKREYSLLREDQDTVEIHLYQDHTGQAQLPEHAIDTGISGTITDIPRSADGVPRPLEVEFSYDLDGCAKVKARIPSTDRAVEIDFTAAENRMSETEKRKAAERFSELTSGARSERSPTTSEAQSNLDRIEPARAGRFQAVLSKALDAVSTVPEERRDLLESAIERVGNAIEQNDEHELEVAGDELVDVMFEIDNDF